MLPLLIILERLPWCLLSAVHASPWVAGGRGFANTVSLIKVSALSCLQASSKKKDKALEESKVRNIEDRNHPNNFIMQACIALPASDGLSSTLSHST